MVKTGQSALKLGAGRGGKYPLHSPSWCNIILFRDTVAGDRDAEDLLEAYTKA
jgi:hypothetical protein